MSKTRITRSFLIFLVCLILASVSYVYYWGWRASLVVGKAAVVIKVSPNASTLIIANMLHEKHYVPAVWLVKVVAELGGYSKRLKFGEYRLTPGMTLVDLLENIATGSGRVLHKITLIEGWTFGQVRAALLNDDNLQHLTADMTDAQIMQALGHAKQKPEGLFFPDTYFYVWQESDLDILRQAFDKMQGELSSSWLTRAKNLPYQTAYKALIVASLIESEATLAAERPIIASVIVNRLRKGMRLQIDPTVMYGLNMSDGRLLSKKDLKKYTPYNTYRTKGLPPTPINMPGLLCIQAALHPDKTPYLFYVARGDGSHQFSKNYQQQVSAVKKYLRKSKKKKGNISYKDKQRYLHIKESLMMDSAYFLLHVLIYRN